jgi:hypothetical protein
MYCDKCFVDLEKEDYKEWCPNRPKDYDVQDFLKDLFKTNNENNEMRNPE